MDETQPTPSDPRISNSALKLTQFMLAHLTKQGCTEELICDLDWKKIEELVNIVDQLKKRHVDVSNKTYEKLIALHKRVPTIGSSDEHTLPQKTA